jgi:hypothetical protein
MADDLYVIPAAGLAVLDPRDGQALPPAGKTVPRTSYWLRRLRSGDVTEFERQDGEI